MIFQLHYNSHKIAVLLKIVIESLNPHIRSNASELLENLEDIIVACGSGTIDCT